MTPKALKAEIKSGPLAAALAPFVTAGDDNGVASVLNDATRGGMRVRPMPLPAFLDWLTGRGLLGAINNNRAHANAMVASVCTRFMFAAQSQPDARLDPADAGVAAMIGVLVSAGIASADDAAALTLACTGPASRAEVVFGTGTVVTAGDVAAAFGRA